MSTDLFLIAHKVRGEPAFDVATQMLCSICDGLCDVTNNAPCHECDSLGYWWIIPTSGHRAYPYGWYDMAEIELNGYPQITLMQYLTDPHYTQPMPADLPDHYRHHAAPRLDLAAALGLRAKPAQAQAPLPRRL